MAQRRNDYAGCSKRLGLLTRQPSVSRGASCLKQGCSELRSEAAGVGVRRKSERRATALVRSFSILLENTARGRQGAMAWGH